MKVEKFDKVSQKPRIIDPFKIIIGYNICFTFDIIFVARHNMIIFLGMMCLVSVAQNFYVQYIIYLKISLKFVFAGAESIMLFSEKLK
jgi:hypothetical protein